MTLSPEDQYHYDLNEDNNGANNGANYAMQKKASRKKPVDMKKSKVLLKQGSKLNKKIIDYFKKNLMTLNEYGFIFEWVAVYEEEIEYYEDLGVEKFPVLMMDDGNITGVNNITKSLDGIIMHFGKKIQTKKKALPQDDEDMHSFLYNELKSGGKNDDNDKDVQEDDDRENYTNSLQQRTTAINKERRDSGMHTIANNKDSDSDDNFKNEPVLKKSVKPVKSIKNLKPSEIITQNSKGTDEDRMMSKYYEDREETEMSD